MNDSIYRITVSFPYELFCITFLLILRKNVISSLSKFLQVQVVSLLLDSKFSKLRCDHEIFVQVNMVHCVG